MYIVSMYMHTLNDLMFCINVYTQVKCFDVFYNFAQTNITSCLPILNQCFCHFSGKVLGMT